MFKVLCLLCSFESNLKLISTKKLIFNQRKCLNSQEVLNGSSYHAELFLSSKGCAKSLEAHSTHSQAISNDSSFFVSLLCHGQFRSSALLANWNIVRIHIKIHSLGKNLKDCRDVEMVWSVENNNCCNNSWKRNFMHRENGKKEKMPNYFAKQRQYFHYFSRTNSIVL